MKRFFIVVIVLFVVGLSGLVWYESALSYKTKTEAEFVVASGESVRQIADNLSAAQLIKSPLAFRLYLRGQKGVVLQAGDYVLPAGLNARQISKRLAAGEAEMKEKNILIKEGMTNREIIAYLKNNNLLTEDCEKLLKTPLKKLPTRLAGYDFLQASPGNVNLEGFLFPDTYRVFNDATCEDLLEKMLNNFQAKVDESLLAEIKKQKKDLFSVLIMASLLEKEVRSEADMKIVAGIFWRRIANDQRLESCATLAYILGENKAQYSLADTQIDSPYNTYRNAGLPPTPINNPGLQAIQAAVYPTASDYNFFLSRPDTGETIFSRNFEEHKANKAKYLK